MNKWIGSGNLTRDVEHGTTTNGNDYARFTLAVQRKFKNAEGNYECDFINIAVWNKAIAENCAKYLSKGKKCAVVGELQTRSYENKDGIKINTFDIVASEVEFLSAKETESKPVDPMEELPF